MQVAVIGSDGVNAAMNELVEMGPDVSYTFLTNVVTMENFYVSLILVLPRKQGCVLSPNNFFFICLICLFILVDGDGSHSAY